MFIGSTTHEYGCMSGDVETCTYTYYTDEGRNLWCCEDWHDTLVRPCQVLCELHAAVNAYRKFDGSMTDDSRMELVSIIVRMVGDELRSRPSATFDDVCGDFGVDDQLKAKLAWAFV